ncbi:MAG: DedA family protein [Sphingomonadales bacterium]|nr:DedA family protein [Sphingomonadales bacterium]
MIRAIVLSVVSAGYGGILLLVLVETICPIVPSEVIMAAAGVAVAHHRLAFWPLLAVCAIGATLGNFAWHTLGHRLGHERLKPLVHRHGRWLTIEWRDVERGTRLLRSHGHWMVGLVRVSPVMRTMISVPAGLAHMNRTLFALVTLAGTAVWNGLWIAGGDGLAPHIHAWHRAIVWGLDAVLLTIIGVWLWRVTHWQPQDQNIAPQGGHRLSSSMTFASAKGDATAQA